MHVLGIISGAFLRRSRPCLSGGVEAALLILHIALYLTVVVLGASPPSKALAFIALQQAVFSWYTWASVFAPNHKAMPIT